MERLNAALNNIFTSSCGEINSRIEQISYDVQIDNTKTKAYCYCIKTDLNGNLRIKDLVEFIDTKILEYAIPKIEIDKAGKYYVDTGSPHKFIELEKKAKNLFTDLEKTGEGGEILLYILTQEFLRIPQLISKMSLKTSGKLHYQGADGIHVKFDNITQSLNLYWAEAKMYQDINSAISNCLESLSGFLLNPQSYNSTQERDLELINTNIHSNINDTELENLLVRYFDKNDDLSNRLIYKGICFIGFDCNKYPSEDDLTKTTEIIKQEIEKIHHEWYDKLCSKIKSYTNLDKKEIHVFLMPFPSVKKFREYYLEIIR